MKIVKVYLMMLLLISGCSIKKEISIKKQYNRIVCTSVVACHMLDKLGIDDSKVVGIIESQSYKLPKRYANATKVGSPMNPNDEKLKKLKPDLIISPLALEGQLSKKYRNLGIDSIFLNLNSTAGLFKSMEELAQVLNVKNIEESDKFKNYLKKYYAQLGKVYRPKVLVLMGLPGGGQVVATENSYVGSMVKLAGGINVYKDKSGKDFLDMNLEDMLAKKPDIILCTAHAMPDSVFENFKKNFKSDIYQKFEAVKSNKVYYLDYHYFGMSASFNYKKPLEELKKVLYEK